MSILTVLRAQKQLIHETDWNVLIILDACRRDVFEGLYGSYIDGKLKKAESESSCAGNWLKRTFTEEKYDLAYFSGNPFVNSKGVDVVDGFDAGKKFAEVVDAWDKAWSDEKKTTLPEDITNIFLKSEVDKAIVHYMQPHYPYISIGPVKDKLEGTKKQVSGQFDDALNLRNVLGTLLERVLGRGLSYSIRQRLGTKPLDPVELAHVEYGEVEKLYRENLELVLEQIKRIVEEIDRKIVVISDHGGMLGDGRWYGQLYGHIPDYESPELREVPWLEVE